MLKLKNITKSYQIGKEKKIILDNINLDFRNHELVFILGPSGSGKSTLLNIMAGNLKADSGEIWFNQECVSKYNSKLLANYQSMVIGNVFQDYNLIEYMSVYDNIMLGYSNGLSKREIIFLLKKLGIYDKRKIIVSKLSGGEKQRVAIARALIKKPHIILADEPTGALDSNNGAQVMNILRDISKNTLVIVISHDNNLASIYADRIINIKDGKCDYYPVTIDNEKCEIKYKKIYRLKSILKLAIKNIILKFKRTILTSLAISLGVVSMSLVVNLYSNFNSEINKLEQDIVSVFPIVINNGEFENLEHVSKKGNDKIICKNRSKWIHKNEIDNKYINYLKTIRDIKYMTYNYDISMPMITDKYKMIDNKYLKVSPSSNYIMDNYQILYGRNIESIYDILLVVDNNNNVDSELLNYFNINSDIEYKDIINKKINVIVNDNYFIKNNDYYIVNSDNKEMYDKSNITLNIVGIIKEKDNVDNNNYLYYNKDLINKIIGINSQSEIVKDMINNDKNVLGLNTSKEEILSFLGYNPLPIGINLYVDTVEKKDNVIEMLDYYNKNNKELVYIDTASNTIDIVKQFISIISVILILFSIIAIIISSLMIGILTNTRVLERKKEIGILRSLGYMKKDIKRLFNLENIIIGVIALIISLITLIILIKPINSIMNNYLALDNIFSINYRITIVVFIINLMIIKLSGIIPAIKASRMDIVKCIYNR